MKPDPILQLLEHLWDVEGEGVQSPEADGMVQTCTQADDGEDHKDDSTTCGMDALSPGGDAIAVHVRMGGIRTC